MCSVASQKQIKLRSVDVSVDNDITNPKMKRHGGSEYEPKGGGEDSVKLRHC